MASIEIVVPCACKSCYALNPEFTEINTGRKVCMECGGTVLNLQELVDTLADRDSEIRALKEIHESWEMDEEDEYGDDDE